MPKFDPSRLRRDYFLEVRKNNVVGVAQKLIQATSKIIGTTEKPIWSEGDTYPWLTSASTVSVSSSSNDDADGGTGCQLVQVEYLDGNWAEQTALVDPNGQTGDTTITDCFRVNAVRGVLAGTGQANAGDIYVGTGALTLGKPANVLAKIQAGEGIAQMPVHSVPANKSILVMNSNITTQTANKVVDTWLSIRIAATNIWYKTTERHLANNVWINEFNVSAAIPEKTDILVTAKADSTGQDVSYNVGMLLVPNGDLEGKDADINPKD